MQAANLSYNMTDNQVGQEIGELKLDKTFDLLENWKIIASEDSGFGAVALQHGDNIIIAFEGSGELGSSETWPDWIKTDIGVIALGGNSTQAYKGYNFIKKVFDLYSTSDTAIYSVAFFRWMVITKVRWIIIKFKDRFIGEL